MKKILFTILTILLLPGVSFAAIARVQAPVGAECTSATSCPVSFASNTTAGNFILATCRYGALGRVVTVTDSGPNTYIGQAGSMNATNSGDGHTENLQWATAIVGGANTVTCTVGGAASTMRSIISEWSGGAATNAGIIDKMATSSGTGTTPASGSITPSQDNELLYAVEGNGNIADMGAGTDFTLDVRVPNSSSARIATEYLIQTTAAAHDGTFTVSQTNWSAGIASFKAAATAAATYQPHYIFMGQSSWNGQFIWPLSY